MTSMGGLQEISAQKMLIYSFFHFELISDKAGVQKKLSLRDLVELIGTWFGLGLRGFGDYGLFDTWH